NGRSTGNRRRRPTGDYHRPTSRLSEVRATNRGAGASLIHEAMVTRPMVDKPSSVAAVRAMYPPLRALAVTLVGHDEAADLVQDTLVNVLRRYPDFEGLQYPHAYARVVLVRLASRSRSREVPADVGRLLVSESATDSLADSVGVRLELVQGLRRLPPKQRTCLYLRFIEHLDDAAIASVIGCSERTVRSQTSRALRQQSNIFGKERYVETDRTANIKREQVISRTPFRIGATAGEVPGWFGSE